MVARRIPDDCSFILDVVRVFATVLVVYHHISQQNQSFALPFISRLGQEGVIVFFVLSGFLIFAAESSRELRFARYFFKRLIRIYPVLIFSFLISYVVCLFAETSHQFSFSELLGNIFAMQDIASLKPGVEVSPFMGNDPLWSLSYEVFFYLLFPFFLVTWRRWPYLACHFVGFSCCASYIYYLIEPGHFSLLYSYFLVWWGGAMTSAYRFGSFENKRLLNTTLVWLFILTLIGGFNVILENFVGLGIYPFLMFRHFAFGFVVVLLASRFSFDLHFPVGGRLGRSFQFLSSISYGIYAFHYPILITSGSYSSLFSLLLAIIVLLFVSWLVDFKFTGYLKYKFFR